MILKERYISIRRNVVGPVQHMVHIVTTCIVLHNMCTISKVKFDRELIEETEYCKNK